MQYNYSIIIPHYNSPTLLKRCLNSIPQREDVQIIIVDDNSSNEAVNFDDFPGLNRKNTECYFLKESSGAGKARNIGLGKVKGKWILFTDSDDFFSDDAFLTFDLYKDSGYEVVHFLVKSLDSETLLAGKRVITSDLSVRMYLDNKRKLNYLRYRNFACWNKMVNSAFLFENKIVFEESEVNNDVFYSFQIGLFAKKYLVIDKELHCVTYNSSSMTFIKRSVEREFMFFLQAKKRNGFYKTLHIYNWKFTRYNIIYFPYMIKKKGVKEAVSFFAYCYKNREKLKDATRSYLHILNH